MSTSGLQLFRSDRRLAALSAWAVVLALLAQLVLMPLLPATAAAGQHAICFAVVDGAPGSPADTPANERRDHCPFCRLTAAAVLPPPPAQVAAPFAFAAIAFFDPSTTHPAPAVRTGLSQPRAPPAL